VVVSPDGLVLTAAHVVAHGDDPDEEDEDDEDQARPPPNRVGRKLLLYLEDARVLLAECVACREEADVAFLRVERHGGDEPLPAARLGLEDLARGAPVVAVGNPFDYDLETLRRGRKTSFDPPVFHASAGRVRRYLADRGALDARGLGPLVHTAWTYWGHSGCPLFSARDGRVYGIHNSWNPDNAARHGVPVSAVRRAARDAGLDVDAGFEDGDEEEEKEEEDEEEDGSPPRPRRSKRRRRGA
jgi:hypothetical protein